MNTEFDDGLTDIERGSDAVEPIQSLQVSVDGNEFYTRDSGLDHPHHRVSASSSYSNDLNNTWGDGAARIVRR
jgi:hypothetical protein